MKFNFQIFLLALYFLSGYAYKLNLELNDGWRIYQETFNKSFSSHFHELERREIWEDNLNYIRNHNLEYDLGLHSFTLGVNEFSDLSHQEFKSMYLLKKFIPIESENIYLPPLNGKSLPESVDWNKEGFVTRVKNQGQCGSCWAFSTTGSLEGQTYRKNKRLIELSEQQLVDCSYTNKGCDGGNKNRAFDYISKVGGIESEFDYPYQGKDLQCRFNLSKVVATVKYYKNIAKNENALAVAVANEGPISISIDASQRSFQHYKDGIYDEPNCAIYTDHAVLLVGYGRLDNSKYWIVKNSWGTKWGKSGYIWMIKDKNNQCAIASFAGFPIV